MKKELAALDKGWVIANHILVSFHVAFISSVLSLSPDIHDKVGVLKFMFVSQETIVSIIYVYITFHIGIAIHEMGHYITAVKLNALNEAILPQALKRKGKGFISRMFWYLEMFIKIPLGKFQGVTKTGLDYHPDSPYNLLVSASGPKASKLLAGITLPIAFVLLAIGIVLNVDLSVYAGRLFLGIGLVGFLDFQLADPGKYKEFRDREKKAKMASTKVEKKIYSSSGVAAFSLKEVKEKMVYSRMQKIEFPDGRIERVPWEFRNCGMGGRHTEKEFPESNVSLQESMFIPLSVKNYENAQEMTVALQNRLKEIIENAEGCLVKGIGTEGGIAPYIKKEEGDLLPVQRLWRMQKQAILDCGYIPGVDVGMAIDPAASELENAYRIEKGLTGAETIGMYLAWRDKDKIVLSRDMLLEIYRKAIEDEKIPIISIEDAFSELDNEGWEMLMKNFGDRIHVVGDDNITTKDSSIEEKADKKLINTALIKLNQIGSVTEGILALLTAMGKNLQTIISHRSKSPIEDFEAQVALGTYALGLKAGGGSNSERLFKYESIIKVMKDSIIEISAKEKDRVLVDDEAQKLAESFIQNLSITDIVAREESTNAGLPTVAVEIKVGILGSNEYSKLMSFTGATPLGTSAGTDEAIHLVDSIIPNSRLVKKYTELFEYLPIEKTYRFKKIVDDETIEQKEDPDISEMWRRAKRYNGKGCMNAVDNVNRFLSEAFIGKKISGIGNLLDIDNELLKQELKLAKERGLIDYEAPAEDLIKMMQRKGNLGMNAILSLSLALARLKGAMKGEGLYEVIRRQMTEAMADVFSANNGAELLEELADKMNIYYSNKMKYSNESVNKENVNIKTEKIISKLKKELSMNGLKANEIFMKNLSYEDLVLALQVINENKAKDKKLYEIIREQLPVYKV
ncbi:MAG: hypothetical protein GXO79_00665 [Chlorobi bacterium]|nr:hypothetical protein [Chlorobiota bacterium]